MKLVLTEQAQSKANQIAADVETAINELLVDYPTNHLIAPILARDAMLEAVIDELHAKIQKGR